MNTILNDLSTFKIYIIKIINLYVINEIGIVKLKNNNKISHLIKLVKIKV